LLALLIPLAAMAAEEPRALPKPLPGHPGNVFLQGEQIVVSLPQPEHSGEWRLLDYESNIVSHGTATGNKAVLGKLFVGYYELQCLQDGRFEKPAVTIGVLAPLAAPTPRTSPIGVDVGTAWHYSGKEQESAANLCALAGINWVRDRLSWREMEPAKGRFAQETKYDETARKQANAGLQVLQVYHDSPSWANKDARRAPTDLRDAYRFLETMARRWRGEVLAFEPWNEADIPVFGGHTGTEMSALQKASYLGLKSGNPNVTVCQNVFASPQPNVLADFNANRVSPYFDTFNLHHYCPLEEYPAVYAAFRAASAGKPMWLTEFSMPIEWSGDAKDQEPTARNLRLQAERVPQVFASALYEIPQVAFYFMLGHFCEGQTQFGLLHKDLTPRPGYLALAAVGRLLADAKPLGRLRLGNNVCAFAFRARPDGEERDVIVAWAASSDAKLKLPAPPLALFDHLGCSRSNTAASLSLSAAPIYVVCKRDWFKTMPSQPPPASSARPREPLPSPIVLQALIPPEKILPSLSAYLCSSERPETFSIFAYNFDGQKAAGKLSATAPDGWSVTLPPEIELAPSERKELTLTVDCRGALTTPADTLRIAGDFGAAGETVLSFRLAPQPFTLVKGTALPIPGADQPDRWQPLVSGGAQLRISRADGGGITFNAHLGGDGGWVYPWLALESGGAPANGCSALVATLTSVAGRANFRAIFEETNHSAYFADFYPQPQPGETVEAIALLSSAIFGQGWSAPDDNGQLDAEKIKTIRIGCNPQEDKVTYTVKNIRWVTAAKSEIRNPKFEGSPKPEVRSGP
jgi:hypothetical protein